MMSITLAAIGFAVCISGMSLAQNHPQARDNKQAKGQEKQQVSKDAWMNWPESSQVAIMEMKKKYGEPDEMTASLVIWHDNGPWKRTVVYKEAIDHEFPLPHKDVMEQFIDYDVPADKASQVITYDGSVVLYRTNGEISARCDQEPANFLALNLANDVATGKKSVEEARKTYAQAMEDHVLKGQTHDYLKKLQFNVNGNTADSDEKSSLITKEELAQIKQIMEEKKEKVLATKD